MRQSLNLRGPEATESLAADLARLLPADASGWCILLQGELGAGKSTFARAVLRALGHEGPVPSPTYTLVEPYSLPRYSVYHIDLYRITSESELEFLGWADLQDGLMLVEWPERVPGLAAQSDIRIVLEYALPDRQASVEGLSQRGIALVSGLGTALPK